MSDVDEGTKGTRTYFRRIHGMLAWRISFENEGLRVDIANGRFLAFPTQNVVYL